MFTINQFTNQNLYLCLSPLVSILSSPEAQMMAAELAPCQIRDLVEQAVELTMPLQDYDEAARSIGYYERAGGWAHDSMTPAWIQTAQEVCETQCIEPYYWEVYEHWAVSDCLAHRLQTEGEHVDTDFAGLNIWARTTTGQAVSADGVIIRIFRNLTSARAGE